MILYTCDWYYSYLSGIGTSRNTIDPVFKVWYRIDLASKLGITEGHHIRQLLFPSFFSNYSLKSLDFIESYNNFDKIMLN